MPGLNLSPFPNTIKTNYKQRSQNYGHLCERKSCKKRKRHKRKSFPDHHSGRPDCQAGRHCTGSPRRLQGVCRSPERRYLRRLTHPLHFSGKGRSRHHRSRARERLGALRKRCVDSENSQRIVWGLQSLYHFGGGGLVYSLHPHPHRGGIPKRQGNV